MPERSQIALVWVTLVFTTGYGFAMISLFDMFPPPDATLSAAEIAQGADAAEDRVPARA